MSTQKNEHNPATELKPCPFCGGRPRITGIYLECDDPMPRLKVICDECDVSQEASITAKDYRCLSTEEAERHLAHHALKSWNRRITPPTDTTGSGREGETPETDRECFPVEVTGPGGAGTDTEYRVDADFARKLERQRDAALAQVEALRRDGERLQWMIDHAAMVYKMQRATKRRDPFSHMETVWVVAYTDKNGGEVWGSVDHGHADPRAAIDSAQRQEGS